MKNCKNRFRTLPILMLLLLPVADKLQAQDIQLNFTYLQGVAYTDAAGLFKGGSGISAEYLAERSLLTWSGGIEFRTVQWGSQLSLMTGIRKKLTGRADLAFTWHNGLALFYEKPLYVGSAELKVHYSLLRREKINLGLFAGFRYSFCPAYSQYSLIHDIAEVPAGLYFRF